MRKRRRLADKLTIIVCAVLVAVSAFFYAPMDVSASSGNSFSHTGYTSSASNGSTSYWEFAHPFVSSGLNDTTYYEVEYKLTYNLHTNSPSDFKCAFVKYNNKLFQILFVGSRELKNDYTVSVSGKIIESGNFLSNNNYFGFDNFFYTTFDGLASYNFTCEVKSVKALTGVESASYQQGYNAGYSAGEQAGESNGYSNGYSAGFEAGEQSAYDSGFQAGQDSVDTESYYDLGYSAGYDTGYLIGYESGYDEGYFDGFEAGVSEGEITGYEKGYEDALEYYTKGRVSNVPDFSKSRTFYFSGGTSVIDSSVVIPTNYTFLKEKEYNIAFDISWTSQVKSLNNISGTPSFSTSGWEFDLCGVDFDMNSGSGHFSFDFIPSSTSNTINMSYSVSSLFFPADWSTAFSYSRDFNIYVKNIVITSKTGRSSAEILEDMERQDLNTQNTIRDGFSDSMNGFDNSQGNAVNDDLSSGLNDFETAEDSLFSTATTGMKDFAFFDISSVPAMVTGMSFVGSIMSGWFTQAGGASGVGIVLSILFSIMLVAMVLGLYRWYQSKGGKD